MLLSVALAACGPASVTFHETSIGRSGRQLSNYTAFVVRSDMSDQRLDGAVRESLVSALLGRGLRQEHTAGNVPSSTLVATFTDRSPTGASIPQQAGNTDAGPRYFALRIDSSAGAMVLDVTLRGETASTGRWREAVRQQLRQAWDQL